MGKGRSWAGKGQGLLPAAHTSVVQMNQMPMSPPIPQLSDFTASNFFFFKELSQFPSVSPSKAQLGAELLISIQRQKTWCVNALRCEMCCQPCQQGEGLCCSGLLPHLTPFVRTEVTLPAASCHNSGRKTIPAPQLCCRPSQFQFLCPFSWGSANVIKISSSRGCSGMPAVPGVHKHDAPKLNNLQDIR